jgi:hypothetical protein
MKRRKSCLVVLLLLVLSPTLMPVGAGVPASPSGASLPALPPRLEINGEPAPVNLSVVEHSKEIFVPATTLMMLGWHVRWENGRQSVVVSKGDVTIQLTANSSQALVRSQETEPPTPKPIRSAALFLNGQLWLPASALKDVLQVNVEWDGASRVLRLGEVPAPPLDKVRDWCNMLDIPDPTVFHKGSGFRVQLQVPQGRDLAGQEFVLVARANGHACVQIYEIYGNRRPTPLFGKDDKGLVYFPEAEGVPAHWDKMVSGRTGRYHLSHSIKGKVTYIAIATPYQNPLPPADLLNLLRRSASSRTWSISAVELEIQPL